VEIATIFFHFVFPVELMFSRLSLPQPVQSREMPKGCLLGIKRMARKRHRRAKHEVIRPWPEKHPLPDEVAAKASYVGSSEHKDYASDAGPPALRSDAARCDPRYTDFAPITEALREAIRRRCSGAQFEGEFPGMSGAGWMECSTRHVLSTVRTDGTRHGRSK
jgi:hypothetical protein